MVTAVTLDRECRWSTDQGQRDCAKHHAEDKSFSSCPTWHPTRACTGFIRTAHRNSPSAPDACHMGQKSVGDTDLDTIQRSGGHLKAMSRQMGGEICSRNHVLGGVLLRIDREDLDRCRAAQERQSVMYRSSRLPAAVPSNENPLNRASLRWINGTTNAGRPESKRTASTSSRAQASSASGCGKTAMSNALVLSREGVGELGWLVPEADDLVQHSRTARACSKADSAARVAVSARRDPQLSRPESRRSAYPREPVENSTLCL